MAGDLFLGADFLYCDFREVEALLFVYPFSFEKPLKRLHDFESISLTSRLIAALMRSYVAL